MRPPRTVDLAAFTSDPARHIEEVAGGARLVVTCGGEPVARLEPPVPERRLPSPAEAAELVRLAREIRFSTRTGPQSLDELVNEGRP